MCHSSYAVRANTGSPLTVPDDDLPAAIGIRMIADDKTKTVWPAVTPKQYRGYNTLLVYEEIHPQQKLSLGEPASQS